MRCLLQLKKNKENKQSLHHGHLNIYILKYVCNISAIVDAMQNQAANTPSPVHSNFEPEVFENVNEVFEDVSGNLLI